MTTQVRFFESETEPATFIMGAPNTPLPHTDEPPLYLPKKYEKVWLPNIEHAFIVTEVTHCYDESGCLIDIIIVPEDAYSL